MSDETLQNFINDWGGKPTWNNWNDLEWLACRKFEIVEMLINIKRRQPKLNMIILAKICYQR